MRFDDDYEKIYNDDGVFYASYYQVGIDKNDSLEKKIRLLKDYDDLCMYLADEALFCK